MPLQVLCYERADDRLRRLRRGYARPRHSRHFPISNPAEIPMAAPVIVTERVALSARSASAPAGAPPLLRCGRPLLRAWTWPVAKDHAFELPWTPAFLHKHGGLVLSIGQFNQWVGSQLMASGLVQIWPGTPVAEPLFADRRRHRTAPRRPGRGQGREPAEASCPAWTCTRN